MSIARLILFHGYGATPSDHWFGWLTEDLARDGIEVQVPTLSDPTDPDRESWVRAARETIGTPDEETVVVGHSLGAVTALHALDRIDHPWRLGGFIAVSGFTESLPALPSLDTFTMPVPDLDRTAERTKHRAAVLSDNDEIVPPAATRRLAAALDAATIVVPGGGHFLGSEGITRLPALARHIREL